jgi:hypothetical protein
MGGQWRGSLIEGRGMMLEILAQNLLIGHASPLSFFPKTTSQK